MSSLNKNSNFSSFSSVSRSLGKGNSNNFSKESGKSILQEFDSSFTGYSAPLLGLQTKGKKGENSKGNENVKQYSRPAVKKEENKQEVVSITYEEIGLFPRSFSRVLDRFLKQIFSDVENLVIQEYRFYRYLFLTTLKCLLILFFVPFFVNFLAKTYVVRPLTEYF